MAAIAGPRNYIFSQLGLSKPLNPWTCRLVDRRGPQEINRVIIVPPFGAE
jgi:hypothetical protein